MATTKIWQYVELTHDEARGFRAFLKEMDIKFETSECFNNILFSIFGDETELDFCEQYLDTL